MQRRTTSSKFNKILVTPHENKFITVSGCGNAIIWDINGLDYPDKSYNLGEVKLIAFNHDGSKILTVSSDEKILKVWDVENGEEIYRIANPNKYCFLGGIALSPDGTKAASGGHFSIYTFDFLTGNIGKFDTGNDKSRVS